MDERSMRERWHGVLSGSRWEPEAAAMLDALAAAGAAVRDFYDRAVAVTYAKDDGSPVTDADLAADRIIRGILSERFPGDAQLTEESQDHPSRVANCRCWIVDPIDGTQQFVERTGNFDVLIALVLDGRPVVAGALQPPTGVACLAIAGEGAWQAAGECVPRRLRFAAAAPDHPVIGGSVWFGAPENRTALADVARDIGATVAEPSRIGFTPRSFLDPRPLDALLGFRMGGGQRVAAEWDIAVGDLFVHEAGGAVTDLHGARFRYNQPRPVLGGGIVAAVHAALHARSLAAIQAVLAERGVPIV